jgi:hypothetical protein
MAINGGQIMIDIYATEVQAVDKDGNLLFTLKVFDANCCTMSITNSLLLDINNLEETLDAVRRGVKLLGIEQ